MIFSFLQVDKTIFFNFKYIKIKEKQNFVNNENKVKCFGILLIEFFKYYSEFNFSTTIIEPKLNVLETNAINVYNDKNKIIKKLLVSSFWWKPLYN